MPSIQRYRQMEMKFSIHRKIKGRLQIFKVDVNSGIRTQLTHLGGSIQANAGGDWFDPAYALPVSPQPQLLTTTWGDVKKKND